MGTRLMVIVVCGVLGVGVVRAQADFLALASEAAAAYQREDYGRAAALYESLLDAGFRDGALYYNLGHTYFQAGDLGRALLNYRRGQVLMPRDADLGRQLSLVRGERRDLLGDETGFLEGLAALTVEGLRADELGALALLVWFGWSGLLALAVLRPGLRQGLRAPLAVGAVVVLAALLLLGSRLWVEAYRPAAVVIAEQAEAKSGPGAAYLDLFRLYAAAEVRVIEARGGWLRFSLPDARQGWIPAGAVERVSR